MMLLLRSTACLLALLIIGCVDSGSGTGSYCLVYSPIYVAAEDVLTTETAKQILVQNETYAQVCKR